MRLFLDVQQAQELPLGRGLPRYVASHAAALDERDDIVARLAIRPSLGIPPGFDPRLAASPRRCDNSAEEFGAARAEGPVAYHAMSPFSSIMPLAESLPPWALDGPLVATLYDLIPLTDPEHYLLKPFDRLYWSRLELVRTADLVLAISEYVAEEAVERLDLDPRRIAVIGGGCDPYFGETSALACADAEARLPGLDRPFAMTVSFSDPRKNTRALIRSWAALAPATRREHQLAIVGDLSRGDEEGDLRRVAREAGLGDDDIVFPGAIDDELLRWMYQHARLVVCPSLLEGFGLPVIEACVAGAPTITSDRTSLPEIVDWPPSTFDPTSVDAMADVLESALSDDAFRGELADACARAARRVTWSAVAERTVDAVRRLG